MHIAQGYFDSAGNPCLKVTLKGVFATSGLELEAILDTGFTGFLAMPMMRAFPIGLPLFGTTSVVFADGSKGNKLTAFGTLSIGNRDQNGVVILEENASDVLLGMDFLRTFKAAIVMTKDTFSLLEHDWIDQIQAAGSTTKQAPPPTGNATAAAPAESHPQLPAKDDSDP